MSEVQTVSAVIHEVVHSLLHNREAEKELQAQQGENTKPIKPKDRNTEEVEAESISFAVCSYYGIQTADNSLGYIAAWSKGKELAELRASLETINKTSSELISGIDTHFAEIIKERGIDITTETPALEQAPDIDKGKITEEQRIEQPVQHDYPMPDPDVSITDRNAYGYTADELLPLSKERAIELWEQDLPVFILYQDNTEAMIFDIEEMKDHDGLFGIATTDWQTFFNKDKDKDHLPQQELETQFLEQSQNAYAIYHLKSGEDLREYRFEGMERLSNLGLTVERDNYDLIYTAPLADFDGNKDHSLNKLFEQFNINHPADFKGHSLSVSDIVALKVDSTVSSHYVDRFGFKELPQFLKSAPPVPDNFLTGEKVETPRGKFSLADMTKEQMAAAGYGYHHSSNGSVYLIMGNGTRAFAIRNEDNPLRTAEMSTEQNYNQIDGIINNQPTVAQLEQDAKSGKPISLMDLLDATRREQKANPPQKKEKTAPSKGAEME